jgi:hypothetical protein
MPFNPESLSSLEQQEALKPKTGLEGFYTPEFQKTLKTHPKPFVSILQNDPTAYKTIADIIGEDKARQVQLHSAPTTNEKNPENYSEDPTTAQIQKAIYDNLGISVNTDSNGFLKKLIKGCIDGLIIWNVELIQQIREKWLSTFLSQVVSQFATTDWWKKLFAKIWDDIGNIFSLDAYKTWKTGSEYIWMIWGAGLAGWALKKWWKALAETGAKVAIKAEWKTLVSSALETTGKWMVKTGEVLQVPYKAVEKVTGATIDLAWKWVRAGTEALNKVPWVNKVASAVKSNVARIVVGEWARVVASRETPTSLKYQIWAVWDDVSKIKPFEKWEWKPVVEDMKTPVEEPKIPEPKVEKKELGFDISNNPVYKENPFLEQYADVLWDLKPSDIISDIGTQGFIVKPEKLKGYIAKIERPNAVDSVLKEFDLHNEAYNIWRKWRKEGSIPENIYVPKVDIPKWVDSWLILIEQIQGQSLHTKSLIENAYKTRKGAEPLTQAEKETVSNFTDWEAKRFIMEKYNMSSADAFKVIELYSVDYLWPYLYDRMRPTFKTDLSKALAYLQNQVPWINHIDIHPWNIMVTNDGKIYIIDWWRAKITNVPSPTNP